MYIGKLAKLTGCTPKAIRLYEELGLFAAPPRQGRYRIYTPQHVDIVRLIRIAQAAGFKLAELSGLLASKQREQRFPLELAHLGIATKRLQVQAQIAELHTLDARLVELGEEANRLFAEQSPQRCSH
ncbi:MerR family transcriptional regulator [Pseudomonas alcaligenes]|uniref:MerR family transcriptional regulator n=1 Tax=Aquipseudomonas alcaligenes TaxID=43263 RepID=A0ABR7RZJ0_AQUAC|nr:MerR family transcriptional regulator [Pseudomonas alcaligenes]MBC9250204.1 MerR family transcriptional regulator [Pseudomonas alcaligenes]